MQSVVFVGNSRNVSKLGHKVDQADYVVRFNNFDTKGHEEYVGSKWNCCCRRSCDDVILHQLLPGQWILNCVTWCSLSDGMENVARRLKLYYKAGLTNIDVSECKRYAEQVGLVYPQERASVGLLCICWFNQNRERLGLADAKFYLHGFDWFECKEHLTGPAPKDHQNHSWEKEKQYILGMPNVQFLDENTTF